MKMALCAAAAAMLACAMPASAATWVISGGTLETGDPEGMSTFSGTIDYDAGVVTGWHISVSGGPDGSPFIYSNLLAGHSVDAADGTPAFLGAISGLPIMLILDLSNLELAGPSPVTPLTGGEIAGFCFEGGCFPIGGRTITGGTAMLAAVPEPGTWAMMLGGVGMIGGAMRRRRAKVSLSYA